MNDEFSCVYLKEIDRHLRTSKLVTYTPAPACCAAALTEDHLC
jgi:hypothetical protein